MTTEDADTITPQTIINIRPVVAALKEFFGSSQLSAVHGPDELAGRPDAPPAALSALGAGGLTRERAPIEVRDVHPTHYGRMCPIETPEGPNIGLIGSLSSYADRLRVRLRHDALPPSSINGEGHRRGRPPRRQPGGGAQIIAQANTPVDAKDGATCSAHRDPSAATQAGQYVTRSTPERGRPTIDVSPEQIWSVATAMIPFLEHDDANRALMGSNMQRQAVPLLKSPTRPFVGTGMERRAAIDTGDVADRARRLGHGRRTSTPTRIVLARRRRYAGAE